MKTLLSILTIITISYFSSAQTIFNKSIFSGGLIGQCIAKTKGNGFMIGCENYVACFDSGANVLWGRLTGNPMSIVTISDSSYLVFMIDSTRIEVANFNDSGDTLNTNSITFYSVPGINKGIKTLDGGAIVCGGLNVLSSPDSILLVKVDSIGTKEWSKSYRTGGLFNKSTSIIQLPDSTYLLTGLIKDSLQSSTKGCLLKISSTGDIIWNKIYSTNSTLDLSLIDIIPLYDSLTFLVCIGGTFGIMRTDSMGNTGLNYVYSYPNNYCDFEMKLSSDSNFIISSMTDLFSEYPGELIKIDYTGNALWSKSTRVANKLMIFDDGGIMLLGNHYVSVSYDMGLMKSDSLGNGVDCWIPHPNLPSPFPILPFIEDTATFNTNNAGFSASYIIPINILSITLDPGCVYVNINKVDEKTNVQLYPNPSNEYITISSDKYIDQIDIKDILGTNHIHQSMDSYKSTINISNLSPGIYNVILNSGTTSITKRFIKTE